MEEGGGDLDHGSSGRQGRNYEDCIKSLRKNVESTLPLIR